MKTNNSPLEQKLWKQWLENQDDESANQLIENYMYLVRFHVERISSHLPTNVPREELKSFGLMGLFDALQKFQVKRDLKFDTYASFRIRGSIIDGLRKEDWLPRSIREKTKKVEQVSHELQQTYQRTPTSEEIASNMGITSKEVEELTRDMLFSNVLSIEEKPAENDQKEGIGYSVPDKAFVCPDKQVTKNELIAELIASMQSLNKKEQLVISLFYQQELTLSEIGQILDLTTSRISQIHRKAIFKLRRELQKIQALE